MKSIIINNVKFDYDEGCRLLKLKYQSCPIDELNDFWDHIKPLTFKEIAQFENIEKRRVGIFCLGIERLVKMVKPKLVNKQTIKKSTAWVNDSGSLKCFKYTDTYKLYKVDKNMLNIDKDAYFVKCKDTSTSRDYLIWIDLQSVFFNNYHNYRDHNNSHSFKNVTATAAIAWTIQTNVEEGGIEKIIRQGDCILIKKNQNAKIGRVRHITENEYLELLKFES